ncbi:MAG: ORF6C domain-containing protein [Fusobacteriaceae bacterium]
MCIDNLDKKNIIKKINFRVMNRLQELNLKNKSGEMYREIYKDLRTKFNFKELENIKLDDYDRVVKYIENWNGGGRISRF